MTEVSLRFLQLRLGSGSYENEMEEIDSEGYRILGEGISGLSNLTYFSLYIRQMKLSHPDMKYLTKGLSWLWHLSALHLDLSECSNITDESMKDLLMVLQDFPLTQLILQVQQTGISDAGLICLADILHRFKSLEEFKFHSGEQISDKR
eukprot:TRINITY_DN12803_c0_g1_i2.p1 TRINITY_DN12803_c0_g1~~TRINITY_DN12803_c0_g1_i2.p1  ORF type:complete len:149 (+),score=13.95 TRINITY_DN12803_c0_g1_i2:550-996(+)